MLLTFEKSQILCYFTRFCNYKSSLLGKNHVLNPNPFGNRHCGINLPHFAILRSLTTQPLPQKLPYLRKHVWTQIQRPSLRHYLHQITRKNYSTVHRFIFDFTFCRPRFSTGNGKWQRWSILNVFLHLGVRSQLMTCEKNGLSEKKKKEISMLG